MMKKLFFICAGMMAAVTGYGQTAARSVMVNTNGVVVSPTNFWANAPISTNAAATNAVLTNTNGVMLGVFGSGAPTNPSIKLGTTNTGFFYKNGPTGIVASVGGVQAFEIYTNAVTAASFVGKFSGGLTLGSGDSISFNGGAKIAETRTNLGLGATWLTNTNATNFRAAIGMGIFDATNAVLMFNSTNGQVVANTGTNVLTFTNRTKIESINNWRVLSLENSGIMSMDILLIDEDLNAGYDAPQGSIGNGAGAFWIKYGEASTDWGRALYLDQNGDGGIARTNLGLNNTNVYVYAATALWDTANQQKAIRIADMDVEVNSGMLRTNGPTNTTNVSRWINVLNGTNIYKLPLYK